MRLQSSYRSRTVGAEIPIMVTANFFILPKIVRRSGGGASANQGRFEGVPAGRSRRGGPLRLVGGDL